MCVSTYILLVYLLIYTLEYQYEYVLVHMNYQYIYSYIHTYTHTYFVLGCIYKCISPYILQTCSLLFRKLHILSIYFVIKYFLKIYSQQSTLVVQQVKSLVLSLQWLRSLLWCKFGQWFGNFHISRACPSPQKNKFLKDSDSRQQVNNN